MATDIAGTTGTGITIHTGAITASTVMTMAMTIATTVVVIGGSVLARFLLESPWQNHGENA